MKKLITVFLLFIFATLRCIITASAANGIESECSDTVIIPDYVDLGLSVKWATCNLGATKPEEFGRYFAWSDVVGQTWNGSEWSGDGFGTYPQDYDSNGHLTCLDSNDNLTSEYDAAYVNLGGKWRMPTKAEFEELVNNCTTTWTDNYNGTGVSGSIFTSKKNGNSIFLPAAGYGDCSTGDLDGAGSHGYFWSGTFHNGDYEDNALGLCFYSGSVFTSVYYPGYGQSVRPVTE